MTKLPRNTILTGDAVTRLRELPGGAVDCVITSPPYFQLRDYGTAGQLGLEATVEDWVAGLRPVFAEVARALKPSGSLWLNLGDSFSRHARYGAPPKGLLLAPERLVLALAGDGWLVRNKVIWAKTNPMPTSVTDRLTLTYEPVYFLVRSRRYFFDLDAIREPHRSRSDRKTGRTPLGVRPGWSGPLAGSRDGLRQARPDGRPGHVLGKNPGDVWPIATRGYPGAHFATFPEELVRRPILATCPEVVCTACGRPWRRPVTVRRIGRTAPAGTDDYVRRYPRRWETVREVGALVPCGCDAPTVPGVALDPFFGTGTVGVVARRLGRDWLGIELSPEYVRLAWDRLGRSRAVTHVRAGPVDAAA
jgi:site-specific DNA-methyltransferase (adenine-specific)